MIRSPDDPYWASDEWAAQRRRNEHSKRRIHGELADWAGEQLWLRNLQSAWNYRTANWPVMGEDERIQAVDAYAAVHSRRACFVRPVSHTTPEGAVHG